MWTQQPPSPGAPHADGGAEPERTLQPSVLIVIPTFDRGPSVARAVEAALGQSYPGCRVLVVDQGSRDDTRRRLLPFASDPAFCYLRLADAVGAARAKNVALIIGAYDAITFHAPEDEPHRDKVLRQVRGLSIDPVEPPRAYDWEGLGIDPGAPQPVDLVLGEHEVVRAAGGIDFVAERARLFEDFFPHTQPPASASPGPGRVLVDRGLFHRRLFEQLGGFERSVEHARDLRNRILAAGMRLGFVDDVLLTHHEPEGVRTAERDTGFEAARRRRDRERVWEVIRQVRQGLWGRAARPDLARPIDLAGVRIVEATRPALLHLQEKIPATSPTRKIMAAWIETATR